MSARQRGWLSGAVFVAVGSLLAWCSLKPAPASPQGAPSFPPSEAPAERGSSATPAASSAAPNASEHPASDTAPAPAKAGTLTPAKALDAVQRLVNQGKIGAARSLAESYLNEIPDGPEAAQIKSLTGVHPHATGAQSQRKEPRSP